MMSLVHRSLAFIFVLLFSLGVTACASRYRLEPTAEKPEVIDGIRVGTLVVPKCVLQVGTDSTFSEEMLLRVRITSKSDSPFDFDPTTLTLSGAAEVVPTSPIAAQDPERYVKELKSAADLFDSRTQMESYQGIEALSTLKNAGGDSSIDSANSQYREKQRDAASSREAAAALRKRIGAIEPGAMKRTTIKPGERAEGIVVFKSTFKAEGPVELESTAGPCKGKLSFLLKD